MFVHVFMYMISFRCFGYVLLQHINSTNSHPSIESIPCNIVQGHIS
jgi:hypothetical protein